MLYLLLLFWIAFVIMAILRQALIVTVCLVVRGPTDVGFCQQLFF